MTLTGSVWTPIGPSPINPNPAGEEDNGLVSAIAVHPNNNKIIYIGTAGGGVWRSADGGDNWTPLFDRQASLAVGEPGGIAIDPSNTNTIYVGTSGRLLFRTFDRPETGTFASVQAGLYKSTDAGASWTLLGDASNPGTARNLANSAINVVLVDPSNSNVVYIATSNGVFVSTNGGRDVTRGIGFNVNDDTMSLVLDPTSPAAARILYAGVTGRGVLRSADGGQNWGPPILSGATAVLANALCPTPPCPNLSFGRFSVALAPPASPPNPGSILVLYVAVEGLSNSAAVTPPDPVGVFMSIDGGNTWTKRATGITGTTYQSYCMHIIVDPTSPGNGATDTIYYGDRAQYVSTDSGNSFTQMSGMHSDTHAWAAVLQQPPATGSIVLCGTDGGLAISLNKGTNWTTKSRGGLQTTLFYNIDLKPDATVVVGGLQDNSLETTSNVTAPGWKAGGNDGFSVAYDLTPKRVYGSENSGTTATQILRSDDDGENFSTNITPWTTTDAGIYIAPLAADPNNANTVYALGSQNLWQSKSGGNAGSWKIVWNGSPGPGNSVAVAPSNSNNVAVAVGTQVWISTDINAVTPTFTNITPAAAGLPLRNVARVAFDPIDPTVVYAVLGGINPNVGGIPQPAAGVFRRTIAGPTWTNISPPPNVPYSALAIDGTDNPPTLYVGTEFGVARSVDSGASWTVLDDLHLPRVPILDLRLRNGRLVAGTYGRGVFAFSPPTGPVISFNLEDGLDFGTVCQGPTYLDITIYNVGIGDLTITSVQRLSGSTNFAALSPPSTPVVIAQGEELVFTVAYTPSLPGSSDSAIIRVISNDPGAPVVDLQAKGKRGDGELAFAFPDSMSFDAVCVGSLRDEDLIINNRGTCPLQIRRLTSSSPDFLVPSVVTFPLLVASGTSIALPIRFQPLSFGSKSGTITIVTDDPSGTKTFSVFGIAPTPHLNLIFADTGNFGHVCVGDILDKPLTLTNSGRCTLSVTGIISSSPDFEPPEVLTYPLTIGPGDALEVPIRFQPTAVGPHTATITVTSDDPAGPKTLNLSGLTPSGKLAVTGSLCIGGVKACHPVERTVSICNVGDCDLHVSSVAFTRKTRHWRLVNNPFPATLHPGSCLGVVVRYRADEQVPRCVELVIKSDDPDHPTKCLEALAYTIWECCDDCKDGRGGKGQGCACCKCCPPDFCEEDDCKDEDDD
jgi:hypothetical protein